MSERMHQAYCYEGETRGGWHMYSVCKDDPASPYGEHHDCVCQVTAPTKEGAKLSAEQLSRRLNTRLPSEMVREFHERFAVPIADKPTVPSRKAVNLRAALILEELLELCGALGNKSLRGDPAYIQDCVSVNIDMLTEPVDIVAAADALADLAYVVFGGALAFGIDLDAILTEVHAANMRKTISNKRSDGKIQKPEGWQPPDIAGVLRAQGWTP